MKLGVVRGAQQALDDQLDQAHLAQVRVDAERKLDAAPDEVDTLNGRSRIDSAAFGYRQPVVPEPVITEPCDSEPLIDSTGRSRSSRND